MKNEKNLKNLLEAIKTRKPLIMHLAEGVDLHMKWDSDINLYRDEMGVTTMNLIQDILKGKVRTEKDTYLVTIEEDKENV